MIVACDLNNGIGLKNELLCHLPADLKYFKTITSGHCILMGRKTFESIGRPLPNRTNLVLSKSAPMLPEGVHVFQDADTAISFAQQLGEQELFIIGGGALYASMFHLTHRIYLTRIKHQFEADTFFPALEPAEWDMISSENHQADDKNQFDFSFEVYETRQSTKSV